MLYCLRLIIKKNTHPIEAHWKILEGGGGGGVLKAKISEARYEAKLRFLVGRESQNKNL